VIEDIRMDPSTDRARAGEASRMDEGDIRMEMGMEQARVQV